MKYCSKCQQTYTDSQGFCVKDGEQLSLDPYGLVGRTIENKYRIDALIGIGGMGAIYNAHHLRLQQRIAFKILQPNLVVDNPSAIDLFEREARLASSLRHDNIVQIYDAGRTGDDVAYIAMEWLDGRTLEEFIAQSGKLSFEDTSRILWQIAAALQCAHDQRIIHRDLKPSNIFLAKQIDGSEKVKLLDFGIGKLIDKTEGSPVSALLGTPAYASPEQFQADGKIDRRTDIYSLGVVLFEMLTGTRPFEGENQFKIVQAHLEGSPPLLRARRMDAPAALEQLISRMLETEPDKRPQRIGDIPELFEQTIKASLEKNDDQKAKGKKRRFMRKKTIDTIIKASAILLAAIISAIALWWSRLPDPNLNRNDQKIESHNVNANSSSTIPDGGLDKHPIPGINLKIIEPANGAAVPSPVPIKGTTPYTTGYHHYIVVTTNGTAHIQSEVTPSPQGEIQGQATIGQAIDPKNLEYEIKLLATKSELSIGLLGKLPEDRKQSNAIMVRRQ